MANCNDPMPGFSARLAQVKAAIASSALETGRNPEDVTLVAAVKTQSAETVRMAVAAGIAACGENRVQEMAGKLAADAYGGARLHFIGHLQTNKVKDVVGRVDLIESVNSLRLLNAIESRASSKGVVQDILLQVNIAGELTKGGFPPDQVLPAARRAAALPHVRLRGLMCIPPPPVLPGENRVFFAATRQLFVDIRNKIEDNNLNIDYLSMGMSGDYEDAVKEGATLVRVGTALFGPRAAPPVGQAGTNA